MLDTPSKVKRFRVGNTLLQYIKNEAGTVFISSKDIFLCIGATHPDVSVKIRKTKGIADTDYLKLKYNNSIYCYFFTPEYAIRIIETLRVRNRERLVALYEYFKTKLHVACEIPGIAMHCPECGKEMPPNAYRAKYCSQECSDAARRRRAAEWIQKKKQENRAAVYVRVCPVCQNEFETTRADKKYCCKECGRIAYTLGLGAYQNDGNIHRKCPICQKEFDTSAKHQVCCSPECTQTLKYLIKHKGNLFCRNCGAPFSPTQPDQEFCSRVCAVEYGRVHNFYDVKKAYPEEYAYYCKHVLPNMPDYFAYEPTKEELLKPEYQRRNSILMSFDPYPA